MFRLFPGPGSRLLCSDCFLIKAAGCCSVLQSSAPELNISHVPAGLYEFVIPEDLPIGKAGGKVKANDRDIGENAKSTYNIIEGDERGMFEISTDGQTQEGILKLKKVSPKSYEEIP